MTQSVEVPVLWGSSIEVGRNGEDLVVLGELPLVQEDVSNSSDFVADYRKALQIWTGEKKSGKRSPHIAFANADTDEKLIRFVGTYGPVNATSISLTELQDPKRLIGAIQNLPRLRTERIIYRTLLSFVDATYSDPVDREEELVNAAVTIVDALKSWLAQWRSEASERRKLNLNAPGWTFNDSHLQYAYRLLWSAREARQDNRIGSRLLSRTPVDCAQQLINLVLNCFPLEVATICEWTGEMVADDCTFGIRPLLYFVLRLEYLHRKAARICQNSKCRQVFQVERLNQRFCNAQCSLQQRLHDNYVKNTKPRRQLERVAGTGT